MCKAFAFRYTCSWEERGRNCRHIHSEDVRNTYELFIQCMNNQTKFTSKMRDDGLNPKKELNEEQLDVMIQLFEKYPREPKGAELARL